MTVRGKNYVVEDVADLLDDLATLRERLADLDAALAAREEAILAPVRGKLEKARQQHADRSEPLRKQIENYETRIKAQVAERGETVKGDRLWAVYYSPRVSWDGKMLEGMMAVVPGLEKARRVSESGSCQIRNAGQMKDFAKSGDWRKTDDA